MPEPEEPIRWESPAFAVRWWFSYRMTSHGFNAAGPNSIGFITLPVFTDPARTTLDTRFPFNKIPRRTKLFRFIRQIPLEQPLNSWGHTSLVLRHQGKLYSYGLHPKILSPPTNILRLDAIAKGKTAVRAAVRSDLSMFTASEARSFEWATRPEVVERLLAEVQTASKQRQFYTAKPGVHQSAANNCVEFAVNQGAGPQLILRMVRDGGRIVHCELVPPSTPRTSSILRIPVSNLGSVPNVEAGQILYSPRNANQSTFGKTLQLAEAGKVKVVLTDSSGVVIAESVPVGGRMPGVYRGMKVWGGRALLAIGALGVGYETYSAQPGQRARTFTSATTGFVGTLGAFPRVYQGRPVLGVADIVVNTTDLGLHMIGAPEHHRDISHAAASLTPSSTLVAGLRNVVDITWRYSAEGSKGLDAHHKETVLNGLPVVQGMAMLGEHLFLPENKRQAKRMKPSDIRSGKHGIFVRSGQWWGEAIANDPVAFEMYLDITANLHEKYQMVASGWDLAKTTWKADWKRLHKPMKHDMKYYREKFPMMRDE
ncbi:MAG: hypothetical protein AAGC60_16720 [Acidobacteriota bacterium]